MSLYARMRASDQPSIARARSASVAGAALSCRSASSRRSRPTRLYILALSETVADFFSVALRFCTSRSYAARCSSDRTGTAAAPAPAAIDDDDAPAVPRLFSSANVLRSADSASASVSLSTVASCRHPDQWRVSTWPPLP
jgi:hypothetical protein